MKYRFPTSLIFMVFFILGSHSVLAEDTPYLRNEMPGYLTGFQETVNEQVSIFPETFFLAGRTKDKLIALTFDDGPDVINTPHILNVLEQEQVSATFYLVGDKVQQLPELVEKIALAGHEIGNHSWSHQDLRNLGNENILDSELLPTSELIFRVTGDFPTNVRPPYGAIRDDTIAFLSRQGWKVINWSIDSFDWDKAQNSSQEIVNKVLSYHHPGAIILMHTNQKLNGTVLALPTIIATLRDEGYTFVTVSELLGL